MARDKRYGDSPVVPSKQGARPAGWGIVATAGLLGLICFVAVSGRRGQQMSSAKESPPNPIAQCSAD